MLKHQSTGTEISATAEAVRSQESALFDDAHPIVRIDVLGADVVGSVKR